MIADPELEKLFKAESDEHLACLDNGLLRLEQTPADPDILEEVFRESHSLKGAARMLGLTSVETAAHRLESIFNAARKGDQPLTSEAIEQMNASLVDLRQCIRQALGEESQPIEILSAVAPHCYEPAAPEPEPISKAISQPIPQPLTVSSPSSSIQSSVAAEPFHLDTVRVETRKLDDLLIQVGELSVIQGQTQHRLSLLEELLEQWSALERKQFGKNPCISGQNDSLDDERLRFGNSLKQTRNAFFDDNARLRSVMQRLQDQVGSMRLLPLSTLFALFPRMVRDLAREQCKQVKLELEGGDITVDKRILEEMKDPLMHLIRNAIDHGIELTSQREQLDKPATATLRLRAIREDAHLLLALSDDGRGLDSEAIRQRASQRGMLDEETFDALTSQQLQQLIFTSGFSTCRYITELSGRGVGLDVVRANVERLKGSIQLESVPGKGLSVQLRLPLSLATTRLLLASAAGRLYGLPVEFIHTSRWLEPEQMFMLDGRPAMLLNDAPVVVTHLSDLLDLGIDNQNGEGKALACVVIQTDHGRLGLLADNVLNEEEVVLKPLGPPLKRVRNVSALAILGSGEICVVLNPSDLLNSAQKMSVIGYGSLSRTQKATQQAAKPAVLLAEDSALIRAMEKRILEDANYEVVTAVDGADALNLLCSRPFAAVVTDITMPNMNGLTLTQRIRSTPRYQGLPVILVTSLASDQDKRRGLEVGANAYIPKPTFDQRVLLDTLKRLIS